MLIISSYLFHYNTLQTATTMASVVVNIDENTVIRIEIDRKLQNVSKTTSDDAEIFINNSKDELKDKDQVAAAAHVDKTVNYMRDKVLRGVESTRDFLLSKIPKEPLREDYTSDVDFDLAKAAYSLKMAAFMKFLDVVKDLLDSFTSKILSIIQKISEFLRMLWEWLKQKLTDIGKKVCDFIIWVKNKLSETVSSATTE